MCLYIHFCLDTCIGCIIYIGMDRGRDEEEEETRRRPIFDRRRRHTRRNENETRNAGHEKKEDPSNESDRTTHYIYIHTTRRKSTTNKTQYCIKRPPKTKRPDFGNMDDVQKQETNPNVFTKYLGCSGAAHTMGAHSGFELFSQSQINTAAHNNFLGAPPNQPHDDKAFSHRPQRDSPHVRRPEYLLYTMRSDRCSQLNELK